MKTAEKLRLLILPIFDLTSAGRPCKFSRNRRVGHSRQVTFLLFWRSSLAASLEVQTMSGTTLGTRWAVVCSFRQEEAKMDRRSVLRQDIQRIFKQYNLFALLFVTCLARGQFTPGTPNFIPQDCHEFDCSEATEHHILYRAPIYSKMRRLALKQALVGIRTFCASSAWKCSHVYIRDVPRPAFYTPQ